MTNRWVTFSYRSDEGFPYWNKPKVLEVLLDTQNGWLLYSPLALLALFGVFSTWREKKYHNVGILLSLFLALWCFGSWWCWWFGGAFGHRCFIEFYAILAFPWAGVIAQVWEKRPPYIRYVFLLAIIFLCYCSVKMSYIYSHKTAAWDGPDWRWNFAKIFEILEKLFQPL